MNKTLITFFTVLFCLTSSVGWSEQMSQKDKTSLAKGILNTLTKPNINKEEENTKIKEDIKIDNKKIQKETQLPIKENLNNEKKILPNDIEKLAKHMKKCFNYEKIFDVNNKIKFFSISIFLSPDGTVVNAKSANYPKFKPNSPEAEIVTKLIKFIYDCSPIPIPLEKYNLFKNFIFDFDIGLKGSN
tara:strand:+ start:101 stop:661 length:561 start_codon:yes stop_codon:yes gene_type:complete